VFVGGVFTPEVRWVKEKAEHYQKPTGRRLSRRAVGHSRRSSGEQTSKRLIGGKAPSGKEPHSCCRRGNEEVYLDRPSKNGSDPSRGQVSRVKADEHLKKTAWRKNKAA